MMIGEEESPSPPTGLLQQVRRLPPFHGIRWNTVLRIFRSWAPKAGSGRYRTIARTVNPQCRHRLYCTSQRPSTQGGPPLLPSRKNNTRWIAAGRRSARETGFRGLSYSCTQ